LAYFTANTVGMSAQSLGFVVYNRCECYKPYFNLRANFRLYEPLPFVKLSACAEAEASRHLFFVLAVLLWRSHLWCQSLCKSSESSNPLCRPTV